MTQQILEKKILLSTTHQPKGGMCASCIHRYRRCSHLDFTKMKVIRKYSDGTKVVKCIDYERVEKDWITPVSTSQYYVEII